MSVAEGSDNVEPPSETPKAAATGRRFRGWPDVANIMSEVPEFAIFRNYGDLHLLCLLYLQADLQSRQEKFFEMVAQEARRLGGEDPAFDFDLIIKDCPELCIELESLLGRLEKYNTALAQYAAKDTLPVPPGSQLKEFKLWLRTASKGIDFPFKHEDPYDKSSSEVAKDEAAKFVTFQRSNPEDDPIIKFISGPVIDRLEAWKQRRLKSPPNELVTRYGERPMARTSNAVSAAISSLMPTICILVLFFIQNMLIRIGLVIVFTTMFSLALAAFTEAKKHEIFGAVAAFAAVEVVFIGSTVQDLSGQCCQQT